MREPTSSVARVNGVRRLWVAIHRAVQSTDVTVATSTSCTMTLLEHGEGDYRTWGKREVWGASNVLAVMQYRFLHPCHSGLWLTWMLSGRTTNEREKGSAGYFATVPVIPHPFCYRTPVWRYSRRETSLAKRRLSRPRVGIRREREREDFGDTYGAIEKTRSTRRYSYRYRSSIHTSMLPPGRVLTGPQSVRPSKLQQVQFTSIGTKRIRK